MKGFGLVVVRSALLLGAFVAISLVVVGGVAPGKADDGLHEYQELAALILRETTNKTQNDTNIKIAILCFKTGEQVSGLNKICFYDCAGSAAAITVKSYQLCPLTINR